MPQPDPRKTFRAFVEPAVERWRRNKNSYFDTIIVISQIDICAEHIARLTSRDASVVKIEREKLIAEEPALRTCRDVHDTHKHGRLTRASASMKHGTTASYKFLGIAPDVSGKLAARAELVLASTPGGASPEETIEVAVKYLKAKLDSLP